MVCLKMKVADVTQRCTTVAQRVALLQRLHHSGMMNSWCFSIFDTIIKFHNHRELVLLFANISLVPFFSFRLFHPHAFLPAPFVMKSAKHVRQPRRSFLGW